MKNLPKLVNSMKKEEKDIMENETKDRFYDRYFSTHISGYAPYEAKYAYAQHFLMKYEQKGITTGCRNLTVSVGKETGIADIVDFIQDNTKDTFYNYHSSGFCVIRDPQGELMVMVSFDLDDVENEFKDIYVDIYTLSHDFANDLGDRIIQKFTKERSARISWHYNAGGQQISKNIYLSDVHPVYDEYYPFLKNGYHGYTNDYLNSKANILIMYGPPGTGKTSFIRRLLFENKLKAMVFYDESMTGTDQILVNFLTRDEHDILVLEDADRLLGKRSEGNTVMSKLLNAADGLVNILNKKIIITTNVTDLKDIDEAMLRPGRCFGVVEFRALKEEEAKEACRKAGKDFSKLPEKDRYTLAEIFNETPQEYTKKIKVGFV